MIIAKRFSHFSSKQFGSFEKVQALEAMSTSMSDKDFVEYVVKAIVDHPEEVSVERSVDEMGVLLTLKVNQQDMGYVIGRSGQTARALRTLLRLVGARNNARVNLKIFEPEGSNRGPRREPMAASAVSTDDVENMKI